MHDLSVYEAAILLHCSPRWLRRLMADETLSSLCRDELEVYIEKAPLIHDREFLDYFTQLMLD